MPREYKAYLRDILEAIGKIERYTENMNFEDFSDNELIQDGETLRIPRTLYAVFNKSEEIMA